MAFTKAFDLIKRRLNAKGGPGERIEAAMLLEYARVAIRTVVDAEAAAEARPLSIKDSTLLIAVSQPLIAQELKLHERTIMDSINQKAGSSVISRIRFLA